MNLKHSVKVSTVTDETPTHNKAKNSSHIDHSEQKQRGSLWIVTKERLMIKIPCRSKLPPLMEHLLEAESISVLPEVLLPEFGDGDHYSQRYTNARRHITEMHI